jgi:hypothetical protein
MCILIREHIHRKHCISKTVIGESASGLHGTLGLITKFSSVESSNSATIKLSPKCYSSLTEIKKY